jgi:uncharacterized protein (DUF2336 family)
MAAAQDLIDELETAISISTIGRRAETLRRVTDLFMYCPATYSAEQIDLFDDVMGRLCSEIETAARATLAQRLAPVPNAPRAVIRQLAVDDAIEVAGPVLSQSSQVDDATLLVAAKTKSQEHLLAITKRETIAESVTSVLIDRGNQAVALSTVKNPGARLSEEGYSKLVERSRNEHQLAIGVWARRDIPRDHLIKLFAEASETVRVRLEAADPDRADMIRTIVSEVAAAFQSKARAHNSDYRKARAYVDTLRSGGLLDAARLHEFARAKKFDETAITLSHLCQLPLDVVERGMVQNRGELVLVFAKSIGLEWPTTRAILLLCAGRSGLGPNELQVALANYTKLKAETAQKTIQFFRLRAQAREAYRGALDTEADDDRVSRAS